MTQSTQLFTAMFECICRGNGMTTEEGFAQLTKLYGERTVDDKLEPVPETAPEPVPEPVLEPVPETAPEPVSEPEPVPEPVPEPTTKRAKYVAPKMKLPWTGKPVNEWCQGLRHHGGLMSQCTMKPKKDGFCDTCQKSIDKKGHPERGTVKMRIEADQQGKPYKYEGKTPVKFATIMKKQKITKEEAIAEATKFGLTIPDQEFVLEEKKKGRPAKQPKKLSPLSAIVNKVVEEGNTSSSEPESEPVPESEPAPEPVAEPTPEPLAEPSPQKKPAVPQELVSEEYDEDYDAETDDEATDVQIWTHGGKKYLKMTDGCAVYDFETHEPIGSYDVKTDTILPCVDEETDEEDN